MTRFFACWKLFGFVIIPNMVDKTNPNNPVLMTPGGTVPLEGRRGTPETNNGQFPQMWGRGQ